MISRYIRKLFKEFTGRGALLVLCAAFIIQLMPVVSVYASETDSNTQSDAQTLIDTNTQSHDESKSDSRVVRVGWYQSTKFQTGRSDSEEKSGYSYDYLQAVSDYTSWNYDYVYGDWSELLEKLENGEIDFLAGVSITEDRQDKMLFPDSAMGTEQYYLCKRYGDSSISGTEFSTLKGKKLGLIKNNLMSSYAEQWVAKNHVDVEIIYYEGFDDVTEAFENGQVDLITSTYDGAATEDKVTVIAETGSADYYMAISNSRKDLLKEMNSAVATLYSVNPYFLQNLQYKNYGSEVSVSELTEGEKQWLQEHPSINVGYIDDYLPYSDNNSVGEVDGLIADALNNAFVALNVDNMPKMNFIAYKNYDEIVAALKSSKIDLAFPITNNSWKLEQDGIDASSEVVSDSGALFYKSVNEKNDIKKIAVNKNNELQLEYTKSVYPDATLVYYDSIDKCLDGVLADEADGTVMDSLRVQYVTNKSKYSSLSYLLLSSGTGKCFGVKHGNSQLLLLLNRAISLLGTSYGTDYSYQYIASFYSYSIEDFIKEHIFTFALIVCGLVVFVVLVLITRLRKKDIAIQEKEELKKQAEVASNAKSVFLFNMSHDIRTPMNAVLGFTNLMENELDDPVRLKDHLGKIKKSGEYLLGLINNVLEVARIDSGKETLDENVMDLTDIDYLTMFENDIEKKNITFDRSISVEHRYVYGDRQKIQEIALNLLSNAVKYTPDGGKIRADIREIPCDIPGYATFVTTVADTGIGMTEEFLEQIFDSFSRERNTTESKIMGTGLGMSIVKKLVDLMGGDITVDSAPGEGSTFTVTTTLCIAENAKELLENREDNNGAVNMDLSGNRILLAEDNELNAEIAITLLEEAGARVDLAKDGVECVDMIQEADEDTYDLILMDIQMPNLNGYDAARRIRSLENHRKASIPIIAMTANAFEEDRKNAIASGMNGHLAKPVDMNVLKRTLMRVLKDTKTKID